MKLKIVDGASQPACDCESWLKHWEKHSGQSRPHYCTVKSCMKIDMVGALVQKADGTDDEVYVYPMCSTHARNESVLDVADNFHLVSSRSKVTAGA